MRLLTALSGSHDGHRHGPDALRRPYHDRYTGRRLRSKAATLTAWMDEGVDVYAYFNNDWHAAAWSDALWLRHALSPDGA